MRLLAELRTRARAQTVYDVDDEAVHTCAQHERSRAHEQRDYVKEICQVADDVQGVVEREHEQIAEQYGDVGPHRVLLESGRRRGARLLDEATQTPDEFARDERALGGGERHGRVGEYLGLHTAQATACRATHKRV